MEYKHNNDLVSNAKELRKSMTKEERHLWYDFLRQYPVRFSRQKVLGKYIADFYCAQAKIVIELDGSQHFEPENLRKDTQRTQFYKVMALPCFEFPTMKSCTILRASVNTLICR